MNWRRRFAYNVSKEDVAEFVKANDLVRDFLTKYDEKGNDLR